MILKVSWDSLWTLSFGLSECRGHGSWLVCEVALRLPNFGFITVLASSILTSRRVAQWFSLSSLCGVVWQDLGFRVR